MPCRAEDRAAFALWYCTPPCYTPEMQAFKSPATRRWRMVVQTAGFVKTWGPHLVRSVLKARPVSLQVTPASVKTASRTSFQPQRSAPCVDRVFRVAACFAAPGRHSLHRARSVIARASLALASLSSMPFFHAAGYYQGAEIRKEDTYVDLARSQEYQGKRSTLVEGARQAKKLVRETSRAAVNAAVLSPANRVQRGIDRGELFSFLNGFLKLLLVVLLVGGILAAWGYWLYWGVWWLVRGRFEVTDGWTAAKCTIVQQRCYVACNCCGACDDKPRMFLSDNCVWLDKTKFIRDARGTIVREDTPHSSAVLSPRMSSLRLLGGGCLVVAFFRAPAAVRMLTLAAMVAVASGSVGGEGDTSMTERQSAGEGGLRGSAVELQSRGDAGSNLTYTQGQDDQRRGGCSCSKAFKIVVEFRVGSACAAGNATCLGVPPAHSLFLCALPLLALQPQKRSCASTQNTRH